MRGVNNIGPHPHPSPSCPVNCEYLWKKTQIEKKCSFCFTFPWSTIVEDTFRPGGITVLVFMICNFWENTCKTELLKAVTLKSESLLKNKG